MPPNRGGGPSPFTVAAHVGRLDHSAQQLRGGVRRDIEPDRTAGGMVVIVISLLMATMQTGAGAAGYEQVAGDVEAVLQAATRPPR